MMHPRHYPIPRITLRRALLEVTSLLVCPPLPPPQLAEHPVLLLPRAPLPPNPLAHWRHNSEGQPEECFFVAGMLWTACADVKSAMYGKNQYAGTQLPAFALGDPHFHLRCDPQYSCWVQLFMFVVHSLHGSTGCVCVLADSAADLSSQLPDVLWVANSCVVSFISIHSSSADCTEKCSR